MQTQVTRADLERAFGNDPKLIRYFEDQFRDLGNVVSTTADNVAATQSIADATAITLSPNDALSNERILAVGDGLRLEDAGPGANLTVILKYLIALNGGYACTFNLEADTNLDLPSNGKVLTDSFLSEGPFADDAAAAAGGIAIGKAYRKIGGTVAWRQT